MRKILVAPAVVVVVIVSLAGCATPEQAAHGRVRVVAAESSWGNIAEQIGGPYVEVTSILSDPNADPHQYEADANNAVAVATAGVIIENGLGYDDFLSKLVAASPSSGRITVNAADVLNVGGSNPNPHLWYDTAALPKVATAIATALGKRDPAHAAQFLANARAFDASLRPILNVIGQIRKGYAGTEIAYTERVAGYLTQAAGLVLGVPTSFPQAVENGSDPSPKDTAAFDDAITQRRVKALIYNAQVTDKQTSALKQLASAHGVPVVGVTETMPPGASDFQAWQLQQAQSLLRALEGR